MSDKFILHCDECSNETYLLAVVKKDDKDLVAELLCSKCGDSKGLLAIEASGEERVVQ